MKKILPFILLAGIGFLSYSCDNDDDPVIVQDNDTFPIMNDATGSFTNANGYKLIMDINIQSTDVVLVYRRDPSASNAWQIIPKTYYLSNGRQLNYNFLFSNKEVEIYTDGLDQNAMSASEKDEFLNNQTFRVVLVPADQGKNAKNAKIGSVNYSDYNAVVKYYNLDDTKIKTIYVK